MPRSTMDNIPKKRSRRKNNQTKTMQAYKSSPHSASNAIEGGGTFVDGERQRVPFYHCRLHGERHWRKVRVGTFGFLLR